MKTQLEQKLLTLEEARKFIFGGKSIFTVVSKVTGNRYTYKVTRAKKSNFPYFVSFLGGTSNTSDYQYLGVIFEDCVFKPKRNTHIKETAVINKTFDWVMKTLIDEKEQKFNKIEFWHEGRCAKCGLRLTDPKSIKIGYGKICCELHMG